METQLEERKRFIDVDDSEMLSRAVFDPSFFCDGKLATTAFSLMSGKKLSQQEKYISVLRNDFCDVRYVAETFLRPRLNGDTLVGVAEMKTESIRKISGKIQGNDIDIRAKAKPSYKIPAHAGIFTMINNSPVQGDSHHTSPLWMYVQSALRDISKYVPFESVSSL